MFFLTKILPYINKILFVKNDIVPEKALVVVFSQNEKNECLKFFKNVTTFDELVYSLLQKYKPKIKILSDIKTIAILEQLCSDTFTDPSLKKLISIPAFLHQLADLIKRLKNSKITINDFNKICTSNKLSSLDVKRLKEVVSVWEKYDQFLFENNYSDSTNHLSILMENETIFDEVEFENIYVLLPDSLTTLQKCFFENFGKAKNIWLYGINETFEKIADKVIETSIELNGEIAQRGSFLLGKKALLEESNKIKYCELVDENAEFEMISSYINQKIKEESCSYCDFTIVTANFEKKQKIANFMSLKNIPVNFQGTNVFQKNFSIKLERYIEICKIMKRAGLSKFSLAEVSKLKSYSKSVAQYHIEQLNLYFENLITDIFADVYLKDRFVSLSSEDFCLLNVIESNIDLLKETDKIAFYAQVELLSALYKAFIEQRLFDFVNILYSKSNIEDKTFVDFYKRFSAQVASLQQLVTNGVINEINPKFILEICNRIFEENKQNKNCVELLSPTQAKEKEFKNLIISYPDESLLNKIGSYIYFISPVSNELISNELQKISPEFTKLIEDEMKLAPINELLASMLIKTKNSVLLTKFEQEGIFEVFDKLKNADNKNIIKFETSVADANVDLPVPKEDVCENVFSENEPLKLSASSISHFQKCPRKYFYQNILNLKEESTFSASYGSIVHNLLELFCKKYLNSFTKAKLLELAEILFNSVEDPQKAEDEGFEESIISQVANTSTLSLYEMRQNFYKAVDELDKAGFFNKVPKEVYTEVKFKFESKQLNNIVFDGRIDAIVKSNDGYCNILDYKTGNDVVNNLYKKFSEETLDFESNPKNALSYEYQLPIYYFAVQEADELKEFKDKINKIGYTYIRPKNKGGCKEDLVECSMIENVKELLIKNLQTTIVDKIRSIKTFDTNMSVRNCEKCAYRFVCELNEEELEEE